MCAPVRFPRAVDGMLPLFCGDRQWPGGRRVDFSV